VGTTIKISRLTELLLTPGDLRMKQDGGGALFKALGPTSEINITSLLPSLSSGFLPSYSADVYVLKLLQTGFRRI
jgi:hypothetical protein